MAVYRISGERIAGSSEGFDALGMLGRLGVSLEQGRPVQGTPGGYPSSWSPASASDLKPRIQTTTNREG